MSWDLAVERLGQDWGVGGATHCPLWVQLLLTLPEILPSYWPCTEFLSSRKRQLGPSHKCSDLSARKSLLEKLELDEGRLWDLQTLEGPNRVELNLGTG